MEADVFFHSGVFKIEGLLDRQSTDRGLVVTHPHPLYGGDMRNPVVETVVGVYRDKGYSTLRFNFRGVGNSRGRYDKGVGELQDLLAALTYLRERGLKRIDLAGYSFGAWLNAHLAADQMAIERMIMISPPVAFMDFEPVSSLAELALVVTGSRDDIAPPELIVKKLPQWSAEARFRVIQGADHFYGGYQKELAAVLSSIL